VWYTVREIQFPHQPTILFWSVNHAVGRSAFGGASALPKLETQVGTTCVTELANINVYNPKLLKRGENNFVNATYSIISSFFHPAY